MDRVDQIVQQWRAERPDLDVEPLQVVSRILLLSRRLIDEADLALAPLGLTLWQFDVLAALRRAGAPYRLSPTGLARSLTLSSAAMTHRLDRVEAQGWIRRTSHPNDRRAVQIELTEAGLALIDQAVAVRITEARRGLESLSLEDQRALAAGLRRLMSADGTRHATPP